MRADGYGDRDSSVLVALVAELLVGSVQSVATSLRWNELFVDEGKSTLDNATLLVEGHEFTVVGVLKKKPLLAGGLWTPGIGLRSSPRRALRHASVAGRPPKVTRAIGAGEKYLCCEN